MKIVLISDHFSENMGYAAMCLPKALASLGNEVHVITSNLQVYYDEPFYKEVYEHFLGPNITSVGTKKLDGYFVHRIHFRIFRKNIRLIGLYRKLKEIRPDIVQVFSITSHISYQASLYKILLGYSFFTANHVVVSVFPDAQIRNINFEKKINFIKEKNNFKPKIKVNIFTWRYIENGIKNNFPNLFKKRHYNYKVWFTNFMTHTCYPATIDASDIAIRFYKVPSNKIKINILGVDTDVFKSIDNKHLENERKILRVKLNYKDNDIVCIYTGRFTESKNPLCLAQAIDKLVNQGKPYKAIFIGHGTQTSKINSMKGCTILPFMPYYELAAYYRASDIGVWPKQESTSVLDCTACGLPVIISDQVLAIERKEGNGLVYKENDVDSLIDTLLLLIDVEYRKELGRKGVEKIMKNQSWIDIAKRRLIDYELAINKI